MMTDITIHKNRWNLRTLCRLVPLMSLLVLFAACDDEDTPLDQPDTTPPAAVTALNVIVGDSQVTLGWTDPDDEDFDHVEITFPQQEEAVSVGKGVQTATIAELVNGEAYTFTLTTVDRTGNAGQGVVSGPHTPVYVNPDDVIPPAEISGLSGTVGNRQVTLRWTDPADDDFTRVSVTYTPGGETPIEIGKGVQTAIVTGLENGVGYVFTLKTADAAGNMSAGVVSSTFTPEGNSTPPSGESVSYTVNGVPFTMIYVEGGTFTMGSDWEASQPGTQRSNQAHEHRVTLSSYWMAETEVTVALWNAVMGQGGGSNTIPVASITRNQSVEFARRLNEIAHQQGIIPDDMDFQIPTEAQWEFAAKGGNKSRGYTYAGSNTLSQVGWTSSDGGVHAVKQKQPNELGIYDMSGNVYEWVYDMAAPYTSDPQTNPCNTSGSQYIKRGGSFYYNDAYRFTTTYRYFYTATDHTIGTRISLY